MDFNTVTQFISSVGFPIAITCYLLYQNHKETEKHESEMKAMTEALNGNTVVLEKILTKLGDD